MVSTRSKLTALRRRVFLLKHLRCDVCRFLSFNDNYYFSSAVFGKNGKHKIISSEILLFYILKHGDEKQLRYFMKEPKNWSETKSPWHRSFYELPTGGYIMTGTSSKFLIPPMKFFQLEIIIRYFQVDCVTRWRLLAKILINNEVKKENKLGVLDILMSAPTSHGQWCRKQFISDGDDRSICPPFKTMGWTCYAFIFCLCYLSNIEVGSEDFKFYKKYALKKIILAKGNDPCKDKECLRWRCQCCCQRSMAFRCCHNVFAAVAVTQATNAMNAAAEAMQDGDNHLADILEQAEEVFDDAEAAVEIAANAMSA